MIGITLMSLFFLGILTLGFTILFLVFRQWLKLKIDKKKQEKQLKLETLKT
tara:strand:+ start:49148 stop:49300 length:153 start_codon:yes stop_codon:yes gene_type:complete